MDCNMPVMDGFQASKAIHELMKRFPTVRMPRIVALTAYSSEMFMDKCVAAGMDGFLSKPLNLEELKKILREVGLLN